MSSDSTKKRVSIQTAEKVRETSVSCSRPLSQLRVQKTSVSCFRPLSRFEAFSQPRVPKTSVSCFRPLSRLVYSHAESPIKQSSPPIKSHSSSYTQQTYPETLSYSA